MGGCLALISSVARGTQAVARRYLSGNKSTHSSTLTALYAGFGGIFISMISSAFVDRQKVLSANIASIDAYTWAGILFSALMGTISSLMLSKSANLIEPVFQQCIRTSGIINGYIFQIAIFHEALDLV